MGTREGRRDKGRRRGDELTRVALTELRSTRIGLGVSQRQLARALGLSQSEIASLETFKIVHVSLRRLSEVAALLGLRVSLTFHPDGQPLRDSGHEALIERLVRLLSPAWRARREVPFPNDNDPRWWDLLLRLPNQLVGVEAETRVRDLQALVRRIRARALSGGVDCVLLVLSDSATNRRVVEQLRDALGEEFAIRPAELLAALRAGRPLPGSGVILL